MYLKLRKYRNFGAKSCVNVRDTSFHAREVKRAQSEDSAGIGWPRVCHNGPNAEAQLAWALIRLGPKGGSRVVSLRTDYKIFRR